MGVGPLLDVERAEVFGLDPLVGKRVDEALEKVVVPAKCLGGAMLFRPLQEKIDQLDGEMVRRFGGHFLRCHDFMEAALGFFLVRAEVDLLALKTNEPCVTVFAVPRFSWLARHVSLLNSLVERIAMRLEMAEISIPCGHSVRR